MTAAELEKLLAEVPKSGLICADYTTDDQPGWYIIPGSCVGTIAKVAAEYGELAELFAMAPCLARRVIAAEKLAEALAPFANHPAHDDTAMGRRAREAIAAWEAAQ